MVRGPPPSLLRLSGEEVPHTPTLLAQQATPPGTLPGPPRLPDPIEERRVFTPVTLGELPTGKMTTNEQKNKGKVSEGQRMNGGTQTSAPGTANVGTSKQQAQASASGTANVGTNKQMTQTTVSATTNEGVQRQVTAANTPGTTNVGPLQQRTVTIATGTTNGGTKQQENKDNPGNRRTDDSDIGDRTNRNGNGHKGVHQDPPATRHSPLASARPPTTSMAW